MIEDAPLSQETNEDAGRRAKKMEKAMIDNKEFLQKQKLEEYREFLQKQKNLLEELDWKNDIKVQNLTNRVIQENHLFEHEKILENKAPGEFSLFKKSFKLM